MRFFKRKQAAPTPFPETPEPPVVNRDRVRKLVNALRSGEYQQTVGTLENDSGLCCLGVACRVASEEISIEIHDEGSFFTFDGATGTLPMSVRKWYGFTTSNPDLVVDEDHISSATTLNDGDKLSFSEIADAFERTYLL